MPDTQCPFSQSINENEKPGLAGLFFESTMLMPVGLQDNVSETCLKRYQGTSVINLRACANKGLRETGSLRDFVHQQRAVVDRQ
jgi:hypothetical protein